MHRRGQCLTQNSLAVSLTGAERYERYAQIMAIWTDHNLSDEEGWTAFLAILKHLQNDPAIQGGRATVTSSYPDAITRPTLMLGVEDARILAGRIERVERLFEMGVRILTPLWKGHTVIGGSHDTDAGLTEFGRTAIERAVALGMIVDVSHASRASADEILSIAECRDRPVIASHSNPYPVCPVSRGLHPDQLKRIVASGGVVGLNLYGAFLRHDREATLHDVLPHVEYYLTHAGEDAVCLGCDMDGSSLIPEIQKLEQLPLLAELLLQHGYSDRVVQKLFFENADRFAKQFLKT